MKGNFIFDKYKHLLWLLLYGVFYLISFVLLESSAVKVNLIHCRLDDMIPFCEYFIIPYLLWFVLVGATIVYFGLVCKNREEYIKFAVSICFGMLVFQIVSLVYPNGHNLRPELEGNTIFLRAVQMIYRADTPTNILPSLHVFETAACFIAFIKNEECRKRKGVCTGLGILSVLIILSTMFIKQHSVIDVIFALVLNVVCYQVAYVWGVKYKDSIADLLTKKEIGTIPNLLSFLRLLLAVAILAVSNRHGMEDTRNIIIGLVVLSAVTDVLDGKIARKYNMISEVGKILDPVADKATQGVLLLCFIREYLAVVPIFVLFLVEECFMAVAGARTLLKTKRNDGALWFGKVNTVVFYGIMVILIFFEGIPTQLAEVLLLLSGICMLGAFVLYAFSFKRKGLENTVCNEGGQE